MKMNKLAAGALALALGLGAVAPAVAAENTGAELVLERYEKELKDANAKYKAYLDAKEKEDFAKKELDQAEAERKAAEAAYNALFPKADFVYDEHGYVIGVSALERRPVEEAAAALNALSNKKYSAVVDIENYQSVNAESVEAAIRNYAKDAVLVAGVRPEQFETALDRYVNSVLEYKVQYKARADKEQAYQNLLAAQLKKTAKQTAYDKAHAARVKAENAYEESLKQLRFRADQYGLIVQVGPNGLQIVKPSDAKVKPADGKKSKEELVKALKAAIEKNKVAIASAEFLLENAPKSVAKVKAKLEKQIADAKAIIEKSEKALAKQMAFVATAYADEATDELESLIKENEDSADAINETIKENEKEQPAVEEEEEKKPEEKEEDKKEENKPARQAGTNARTGIAGVAGVAGILAAASVAYAASKRD